MRKDKLGLVGYAFDKGGVQTGSAKGPAVIRERGLLSKLANLEYSLKDFGDISLNSEKISSATGKPGPGNIKDEELVKEALQRMYEECLKINDSGYFQLALAGDHSISIASVSALAASLKKKRSPDSKLGLIWVDTHPDVNTPETSPSQRAFGMSTAFLLGEVNTSDLMPGEVSQVISHENIAYIGLRDVDPEERVLIRERGLSAATIKDIDLKGIEAVTKEAIEVASEGTEGFYVSFDLDVCDPRIVPGTGTPIRGGLNFREAHLLVELLYESGGMLGFELVELNPSLDKGFESADFSVSLIESALGSSIL